MSAVTRTTPNGLDARQLAMALAALVAVGVLLAALAFGRMVSLDAAAPIGDAQAAPVHDHGWSSATGGAVSTPRGIVVTGADGGGLVYNGIPYPAPGADAADGSSAPDRGRFHR